MNASPARDPRRWWILIVLCLSTLVLVVDNMVLTVAVPPLAEDLGASAQDTQWILDSYILVFAGLLLTSGSLGDRFGRRKVMLIGLVLFGVASLVAAFAANPLELIVSRAVMGVGGALIMPSTLSILITVFDDEERRKAMAAWSAVAMLGMIGGPVLGGVLIAWFWWGAVFLINVPIVVIAVIAALTLMPESKGPWQKPDPLGAILSAVGMTALVWTIIELPKHGITEAGTLVPLTIAVVSLIGFVLWERHTPSPMVPLKLFRKRNFSGGSLSLTLVQIGNGGLLLLLTQYLQFVLGYTPTQAGLAFIPMAIASLLCNTLGATLGQKIGNRALATVGMTVMAAGFGMLATLSANEGFLLPGAALFLLGAGGGLAMPAAIAALMGEVPEEQAGVGSALNDTIQQLGAALGIAILGSVVAGLFTAQMPESAPARARLSISDAFATGDGGLITAARESFTSAMSTTFLVSAVGVLAAAVVAFLVMRDKKPAPVSTDENVPVTA
ncbi:MFS transporter [Amycolatopsis sp. WAC 01376]|uniref:MFS transporter n=1 Tax=Amycolatopsis sp. WAC 01376 TaxID=2203195 RepID=UPI000F7AAD0A|nr:MFS transporter [Amycolatopsis sp. WAC 01376]RSM63423.1 MFS transporter [Amycolatopsis sp. WAC 01376]